MASFNINFGQKTIENSQRERELDLRERQIENQKAAQEAATFASLANSSSVFNRANAMRQHDIRDRELDLKEKEFALRESHQKSEDSWKEALALQRAEESRLRVENLRKKSQEYDMALEEDAIKMQEAQRQAAERAKLLDSELATLYLSAHKNGGVVSKTQLDIFNKNTGEQFDFLGNVADIPMANGSVQRRAIGNDESFYMGKFERDGQGNIVYGNDGTPVVSMIEMPKPMQELIKRSAYGKEYLSGLGKESSSGVEIARINAEARRQAEEGKQRRFERGQTLKDDKFAYEVSKDANKEAKDFLSSLSDEDRAAAQKEHADFMASMKKKYGGKSGGDKATVKRGDNTDIRTDKNGVRWRIIRDENGKPIGKTKVK